LSESNDRPVRVRFAPSPTGFLHIGGARTALFNWMFARHQRGAFILRIEDTDRKRYVPGALEDIIESLTWLGLDWDEGPGVGGEFGPYFQSERAALYREWAAWLIEHGAAYRCTCSPERLEEVRRAKQARGESPGYDRHCRNLDLPAGDEPYVVRFKMPLEGQTVVSDLIRGPISFDNAELEDLVLLKSDGWPTYHLANVVDDHLMQVSHIMRGDEWISTAPLHAQLYKAFGWEMPTIAHMPVILNPSGQGKLSKRTQAFDDSGQRVLVQVREFCEAGYLPEALVNFLTNVGWAFGDDREVFSREDAIARFDPTTINPAPARLPYEKLDWLNGVYIRELPSDGLARRLGPFFERAGLKADEERLRRIAPLIQERIKRLDEAIEMAGFFFRDEIQVAPPDLIGKKMTPEESLRALRGSYQTLAALDDFGATAQEAAMRALAVEFGLSAGQLFEPVRAAVTGQKVSPPLFETMEIIGRQTSLARIARAADLLEAHVAGADISPDG
jgi:glutamyl-tRNA synthetase